MTLEQHQQHIPTWTDKMENREIATIFDRWIAEMATRKEPQR